MKFKDKLNESKLNEKFSYSDAFWDFYDKYGEKGIYKECDKFIDKHADEIFFEDNGGKPAPDSLFEKFFKTYYIKDVQKIFENLLQWPEANYDKIGELIKEIYEFGLYLDIDVKI